MCLGTLRMLKALSQMEEKPPSDDEAYCQRDELLSFEHGHVLLDGSKFELLEATLTR